MAGVFPSARGLGRGSACGSIRPMVVGFIFALPVFARLYHKCALGTVVPGNDTRKGTAVPKLSQHPFHPALPVQTRLVHFTSVCHWECFLLCFHLIFPLPVSSPGRNQFLSSRKKLCIQFMLDLVNFAVSLPSGAIEPFHSGERSIWQGEWFRKFLILGLLSSRKRSRTAVGWAVYASLLIKSFSDIFIKLRATVSCLFLSRLYTHTLSVTRSVFVVLF